MLLAAVACDASREVAVRVTIPGVDSAAAPVSRLALVALPYDRDSVLASLEQRARSPRPATAGLDSLFQRFRQPFAAYTQNTYVADKLRDSLAALRRSLESLPRNGPDYRALYQRFTRQSSAADAAGARRDSVRAALELARTNLATRGDSLRALIRHWEDSTYRGYDSIVQSLVKRSGREPLTDTTGSDGWAHFTLAPGDWWIYGRSWDAADPNSEWYWNIPVRGDTVRLSSETGHRRPRY